MPRPRGFASLNDEASDRAAHPGARTAEGGPFDATPQSKSAILTGDFNCKTDSVAYAEIQRGGHPYRDAWTIANKGKPHAPTFCVHDHRYSKQPYCCDFIFVSDDARVARASDVGRFGDAGFGSPARLHRDRGS